MSRVTVVYLWRKVNDPRFAHAFFRSISRFAAGEDFDFVFAVKGYGAGELPPFAAKIGQVPASSTKVMHFADEQTPLTVFRAVSKVCGTEFIVSFNSWSRILAPNWLRSYLAAFETVPDCGFVGASGGYETVWDQPFPNIGIRSNAFMIRTELFNSLDPGNLATIADDHLLEAGPNSMTKQIMVRGLQPIIADRFGNAWQAKDWPRSRTFRLAEQEGLLIADNRTNQYACGSQRKRGRLVARCWGPDAKAKPGSMVRKFLVWLWWNYPRGPIDMIPDTMAKVGEILAKLTGRAPKPRSTVFPN
ncbi:hypothetical protein ACMDCR_21165 [Labrys okinawensis]|uniref:hypothetical protein n=1 Tax=Labrys okinawensis TaxID=346911 RepID=UPI0039BD2C1D